MELVRYTVDNAVATITLNKPAQLNSFCRTLVSDLHAALDQADIDSVSHLVFRANGKGFSGGLDLSGLANESDADLLERLVQIELLLQRVRHHRCSTMALVHGACYGAAADLVLSCRTRIAEAGARFLMPGLRFGIVLGSGRLRDTIGEPAAYRLLDRIKPFKAEEGLAAGFVTAIAAQAEWPQAQTEHLQVMSQYAAQAYAIRMERLTPDTRDADMAALVQSVVHSSIKQRMQQYVAAIETAKK